MGAGEDGHAGAVLGVENLRLQHVVLQHLLCRGERVGLGMGLSAALLPPLGDKSPGEGEPAPSCGAGGDTAPTDSTLW